jgi:hypothetical protein
MLFGKKTHYKPQELAECAQSAIDNWDWDQEDGNNSDKMKRALQHLADNPERAAGSDGIDLPKGWDIWQWLWEFAVSSR